jgi:hypothetical protein
MKVNSYTYMSVTVILILYVIFGYPQIQIMVASKEYFLVNLAYAILDISNPANIPPKANMEDSNLFNCYLARIIII